MSDFIEEDDTEEVSDINIDNYNDNKELQNNAGNEDEDEAQEQELEVKRAGLILAILAIMGIIVAGVMVYLGFINRPDTSGNDVVIATTDEYGSEQTSKAFVSDETEATTEIETTEAPRKYRKISGFLNEKEYPVVVEVIDKYFSYMKKGNTEELLDIVEVGADKTDFENKVASSYEIVEDYQNVTCYLLKGLEADCYVVFVAYDIKFYNVDTPAPSLSRFYVQMDDNGRMTINQGEISDMLNMYLYAVAQYNHVKELINMIDTEYAAAIKEDSKLSFVMGYMR